MALPLSEKSPVRETDAPTTRAPEPLPDELALS
jgi:hypothetical protein